MEKRPSLPLASFQTFQTFQTPQRGLMIEARDVVHQVLRLQRISGRQNKHFVEEPNSKLHHETVTPQGFNDHVYR